MGRNGPDRTESILMDKEHSRWTDVNFPSAAAKVRGGAAEGERVSGRRGTGMEAGGLRRK